MDLKNIDLKNIKLDELISKVKTIEKKVLIKIGIGVGSVIFFLIIYYAVLNPIVEKKKIQLEDMNVKKTEITKFTNEIISIKKKIKKVKPEYENYSTLFHSKAEVEGLYQTLSEYASLNGLVISKIRWIGGFGDIAWLDPKNWNDETPKWSKNEPMMIDHMNEDHANVIQSALNAQYGIKDKKAQMIALTIDGYYIRSKEKIYFINFDKPVFKALDYRKILVKQAKEYRTFEF